jgi:hypothetical protein
MEYTFSAAGDQNFLAFDAFRDYNAYIESLIIHGSMQRVPFISDIKIGKKNP